MRVARKDADNMFHELKQEIAELRLTRVKIQEIPLLPGPFTMSFGSDLKPLSESIRNFGIVNSPVVAKSPGGTLQIIMGYRRIGALRSLGREIVACRMAREAELPPLQALLLNLHDNLVNRKFNPVEKGMILSRLSHYLPRKEILSNYMDLLDLPAHDDTLDDFVAFDKDLDERLKTDLAQGRLTIQAVRMLLRMKPEDRAVIGRLLSELKYNINQQKQFIDYTYDISQTNDSGISTVLEDPSLEEILENTSLNLPQKGRAILDSLRRRRYPTLTEAEKAFRKKVSRLHLPGKIHIQPPPYFESGEYRLEIRFRHGKELKEQVDHLAGIESLNTLDDPWKEDK
jgi:ParB family transcriptional regulator, chromosome partitioning protein